MHQLKKEFKKMKVRYSDLKNKRIFITGGGSGIGASILNIFVNKRVKYTLSTLTWKIQKN